MPWPIRLGVNIDHVATLRNARGGLRPDPVRAAHAVIAAGADGITAHLREDRRHIRDADMRRLKAEISRPLNFEMAATDDMVKIACSILPHACCLVPEKREEQTTEGGLDLIHGLGPIQRAVGTLKDAGIRVSLFIEADEHAIETAKKIEADIVELHTGTWCHAIEMGDAAMAKAEHARLVRGARFADQAGLEVHAGHGLDYASAERLAGCLDFMEFNIGHFLVGEAIFVGLSESIRQMRHAMDAGRGIKKA
jgi:pyridoxine 5-phosphate synthase